MSSAGPVAREPSLRASERAFQGSVDPGLVPEFDEL